MVRPSIKYVFEEKKDYVATQSFWLEIASNPERYTTCKIASFTRVKDLNSKWKHEYVQLIVEEEKTSERARIYAERCNDQDLDQVLFGPRELADSKYKQPIKGKPGKFEIDMPLPLFSLLFDDPKKRPSIVDLADIFLITTMVGGPYVLRGNSCFWFSYQVFECVKMLYGQLGTFKQWRSLDVGGHGGGGARDAWSLSWTTMNYYWYVGDAKKFKDDREGNEKMIYRVDKKPVVDDLQVATSMENLFSSEKVMQDYLTEMEKEEVFLDQKQVEMAISEFKDAALVEKQQGGPSENYSREFAIEASAFVNVVFQAPDAQLLLAQWEAETGAPAFDKDAPIHVQQVQKAVSVVNARITTLLKKLREDASFRNEMIEKLKKDPRPPRDPEAKTSSVKALSSHADALFDDAEADKLFEAVESRDSLVLAPEDPLFEALTRKSQLRPFDEESAIRAL